MAVLVTYDEVPQTAMSHQKSPVDGAWSNLQPLEESFGVPPVYFQVIFFVTLLFPLVGLLREGEGGTPAVTAYLRGNTVQHLTRAFGFNKTEEVAMGVDVNETRGDHEAGDVYDGAWRCRPHAV